MCAHRTVHGWIGVAFGVQQRPAHSRGKAVDVMQNRATSVGTPGSLDLTPSGTAIEGHGQRRPGLTFPLENCQGGFQAASYHRSSCDTSYIYRQLIEVPAIRSLLQDLSPNGETEGVLSRLLSPGGVFEICAELCRIRGVPNAGERGLAPWARRRSIEFMHARLSEDISMDDWPLRRGFRRFISPACSSKASVLHLMPS
jgi:hypothetical protein